MKVKLLFALLITGCGNLWASQPGTHAGSMRADNVLFEIGEKDGSPAEFSLYPSHYKNFLIDFTGVKHFAVGYSTRKRTGLTFCPVPKTGGEEEDIMPDTIRAISRSSTFNCRKRERKETAFCLCFLQEQTARNFLFCGLK